MILGTPVILFRHLHHCRLPSTRRHSGMSPTEIPLVTIVDTSGNSKLQCAILFRQYHPVDSATPLSTSRHSCNSSSLNTLLRLHRCVPSSSSSHLLFGSAACLLILLVTVSCHVLYSGAVLLSLSPHLMDFSDPLLHFAL